MRFSVRRIFSAGVIGIAAAVTPIALSVAVPTVGGGAAFAMTTSAGTPCPANSQADEICYVQSTGSGTSATYQPASGQPTTQAVNPGGGCSGGSPIPGTILPLSAWLYSNNNYYMGTKTPAKVATNPKTGVCSIPQQWSIDNASGSGAEALDFSVGGAGSPEGAGRFFSTASIDIGNNSSSATTVTLVETHSGSQVGSQTCGLAGGATVLTSTLGAPTCSGSPPTGPFDTIEIRVSPIGHGVSVVGTSTVFTLTGGSALSLTKTDSLTGSSYNLDQVITYTLTATNTGSGTVHNVTVSDAPTPTGFSCTPTVPAASLAAGASVSCQGTHTVTQADVDAGHLTDTGSATSTEATATPQVDTVNAAQGPALSVTKTFSTNNTDATTYSTVGQVITYGFSVKNTGNVTLTTVSLSDPSLPSFAVTCAANLAPGASETCTGTGNTHTVSQADLNAGSLSNTVTANGTTATAGAPSAAMSTVTTNAVQNPQLTLVKTDSLNGAKYTAPGEIITYTVTATNFGNVTLHDVVVTDTPTLDGYSCSATSGGSLDPGVSVICSGTHTVTEADLSAGSITDTASAASTETSAPDAPDTVYAEETQICSGDKITQSASDGVITDGSVTASITLNSLPAGNCKNYSYFNVSASSVNGDDVTFLSDPLHGAHVTAQFDWGYVGFCDPNAAAGSPLACPVTFVDFGTGLQPQTFCAAASPDSGPPWCTTSRTYSYVTVHDPNNSAADANGNVTVTHIVETWDGYGDIGFHYH
jgi:uncharacterized repeat protein (TIGR01451 family)